MGDRNESSEREESRGKPWLLIAAAALLAALIGAGGTFFVVADRSAPAEAADDGESDVQPGVSFGERVYGRRVSPLPEARNRVRAGLPGGTRGDREPGRAGAGRDDPAPVQQGAGRDLGPRGQVFQHLLLTTGLQPDGRAGQFDFQLEQQGGLFLDGRIDK